MKKEYPAYLQNIDNTLKYVGGGLFLKMVVSFLPILSFNIYLRENKFFPFEIFDNNQISFEVLSINSFLNFLLISIALFSCAILIEAKSKISDKILVILLLIINLIFFSFLIYMGFITGNWVEVIVIIVLSLIVFAYLYFLLKKDTSKKIKYWVLPYSISIILLLFFIYPPLSAKVAEMSLRQMSIGGKYINIRAISNEKKIIYSNVWLLLRTNNNIYLKGNIVIPATNVIVEDVR